MKASLARMHGNRPDYKPKAEAPQAHVEGSNNRPVSVTELETKLAGLRWQVAEAMKRNGTGRAGSGLRRAVRNTKAEKRRLEDAHGIRSSEHGAEPTADTRQAVVTNPFHGSRPATEAPRTEMQRAEAPRTLDHERNPERIKAFLRYIKSNDITTVYVDGKPLEVYYIHVGMNELHCTDEDGSFFQLTNTALGEFWDDYTVSLDNPPSADTPERKSFLPKGTSQDECVAFFGKLKKGDRVIATEFGRSTTFNFFRVDVERQRDCCMVRGRITYDSSPYTFYTDTSDFTIEQ